MMRTCGQCLNDCSCDVKGEGCLQSSMCLSIHALKRHDKRYAFGDYYYFRSHDNS